MATLYDLTGEVLQLYQMMQDGDIEEDVFKDTLESVEGDIEFKCDSYCKVINSINSESDSLQKEIDRLKARQTSLDNNVKRMKSALQTMLEVTEKQKVKTPLFTVSLRKTPAKLVVTGEVPSEYMIPQDPKVDNSRIKEILKTQELEFAHLEQSQTLQIR
ncbi:siphovirus Gp157 family protein [Anaerosporobacter faecicola]|uniref:siphovirus Gp157 family protein n=1 Tax=Anaerosporobacter faecicola TaxID=2718714 RepID=UPI0014398938|nr:siphovirus Gp157 family protein [Anaerosporobacter faecicola]